MVCTSSLHCACSTQKIVGVATISRTDHSVAQIREVACTKVVIPQVTNRGQAMFMLLKCIRCLYGMYFPYNFGLHVTEVAHDIQQQVSRFIDELGLVNSYDTWHGGKNCIPGQCAASLMYYAGL